VWRIVSGVRDTGLAGRCVIVTGAARGQGAAHARALAAEGARVVLTDVLDDPGEQVAAEIGDAARYVHLDVTSESEWAAAVETAVAAFGPVRVLVNNAGLLIRGTIEAASLSDWDLIMNVNVKGAFLGLRAVLDSMRGAGGGSVVNISSNAGMLGTPNALAYVTSKWAVRGMTKAAAAELGKYGIRVNSIHPGAVATPLLMGGGLTEEAFVERGKDRLAVPRIAEPEEISPAVVYFASDLSGYATGSELLVDGGWAIG
jgi:3alpha(or 20beta)-hydroxysteroid dehydrogenase